MFRTSIAFTLAASLAALTACGGQGGTETAETADPGATSGEQTSADQSRYASGTGGGSGAANGDGELAANMRNAENNPQADADESGATESQAGASAQSEGASSGGDQASGGGEKALTWGYSEPQSGGQSAASGGEGDQPQAAAETKVVEVTANDQMQFNISKFEVAAGQKVKIKLVNIGSLPKAAMGHNMVILKKGFEIAPFAMAANAAVANDYIPQGEEQQKKILAHTKMLGPDEEDTITFTAPSEPGIRKFLCSFPAHYVNMQGDMVVKPAQ